MRLALQCGSLAIAGMGFSEWLRVAGELGFKAMELWLDRNNFWPPTTSMAERVSGRQLLDTMGIDVPSICPLPLAPGSWGEFNFEFNLSHPDDTARAAAVEFYKMVVDSAVDFGANTVLTLPGKIEEADLMKSVHSYRNHLEKLINSLKVLAAYAADRGVTLGVENAVVCNYIDLPWELKYVVESVGYDNVRVYFDTANANVFLPPLEYLDVIGGLLCSTIHVTDNNGDKPLHLPIGMGNIDFPSILSRLKEVGWTGYILPEIFYNEDPIGGLRICKNRLEQMIGNL